MKALSLWQPWASLVALGVKTIETRSWSTEYRGELAIHAARRPPDFATLGMWEVGRLDRGAPRRMWRTDRHEPPLDLPLGCVVATCTLVDVVEMGWLVNSKPPWLTINAHKRILIDDEWPYGDYRQGRFAWLLDDIKPTTERCPLCRGAARIADERPEARRQFGYPQDWRECPLCDGAGKCEPIPARGRQQLWNWNALASGHSGANPDSAQRVLGAE